MLAWLTPEGAITRVRRYGDANEEHPTAFVRSGANLFITRKVVSPNLGQVLALELLTLDADGEVTATLAFTMPAMNEIAALGPVCRPHRPNEERRPFRNAAHLLAVGWGSGPRLNRGG